MVDVLINNAGVVSGTLLMDTKVGFVRKKKLGTSVKIEWLFVSALPIVVAFFRSLDAH